MVNFAEKFPQWLFAEEMGGELNYVIHMHHPQFILEIIDRADGGYESGEFEFFGDPPLDAALLARLARQAGEAFAEYDRRLENESQQ